MNHKAEAGLADNLAGLVLAGGDRDGEPFTVLAWERRFVTTLREGVLTTA